MATENKKIIISVDVKESGSKGVGAAADKAAKDLTKLTQAERQARIEAEKLKITNAAVTASLKQEAAAALQASAANKDMKATSGLNNAILLETSRLASDASYGFTGMANNIGQLVSLFQISAQNAGGFREALSGIGKSLMGTGGVLIAVQLLISFLPRIERFFNKTSQEAKKAKEEIDNLTKSINEQIIAIQTLSSSTLNYNVTGLALQENVDILSNRFKEFATGIKKLTKEQNLNDKTQSSLIKSFLRLNEVRKEIIVLEDEATKAAEKGIAANQVKKEGERTLAGIIIERYRELIELEKLFTLESGKESGKRIRQFKRGFLDLAKLEEGYRQESIYQETLTEEEKIQLKYDNAKEEAQILLNSFVFEETIRLKRFLAESKNLEAKRKAIKEYNQSLIDAEKAYNDVIIQINNATNNKILELEDSQTEKALKIREKLRDGILKSLKNVLDADSYYYKQREINLQQDIKMNEFYLKFTNLSVDQRAKLEVELFNLREQLRQNDLKSEIAALKEKERINLEYVSFAQGIGQLFKTLAGENEEIQKAALIMEKGAAIADIVVRTQASNAQIRAGYAATAALKSIDPTALARYSALATAQISRNNVGAGISIANILATTLTSFKNPAGGTQRGAVQVEAPDFNIVGASPESQLAQSVVSQQDKPQRSFVVLKDIQDATDTHDMIFNNNALD